MREMGLQGQVSLLFFIEPEDEDSSPIKCGLLSSLSTK